MAIFDEEYDDALEEDELAGYTVEDERSIFKYDIKEEEEETIASPIPENEQKVLVDDACFFGIPLGAWLKVDLINNVIMQQGGRKVGKFKPAFLPKLKTERMGQWIRASYYCENPPMAKLEFSLKEDAQFNVQIKE